MKEEEFTKALWSTIDKTFAEIMASKPSDPKEKFLNYADAQTISESIRQLFINETGFVPNKIEATLNICEAVLSPTLKEKKNKIKKAAGIVGGLGGLSLIISEIILALGLPVFVLGPAPVILSNPYTAIPAALGITILAGYLIFSETDHLKNTEKYMKALKESLKKVMPEVWKELGDGSIKSDS